MRYHFIAIGGSVMHALALELAAQGHRVTGSDDAIHEPSRSRLAAAGLLPDAEGWFPERITPELDAVVLGMHARAGNPELVRAQALGLPVYSFPAFIAERAQGQQRIVVAGSHGKTTTTALLLHVLKGLGQEADYLLGATLKGYPQAVRLRGAPRIVIEGDEYLTSALDPQPKFLHYRPEVAILTGIAWDHVNVFPTYASYRQAFIDFLHTLAPGGTLVYNAEDPAVTEVVAQAGGHLTCTAYTTPTYRYLPSGTEVTLAGAAGQVQVFGAHNLSNLAATHGVVQALGFSTEAFLVAAGSFTGADKRLEVVHDAGGLTVIRDFAHAPSKVRATVAAVRERYQGRPIVAVLELHTYSSLQPDFLPHYQGALAGLEAPLVVVDPEALRLKQRAPLTEAQLRTAFGHPGLRLEGAPEALRAALGAAASQPGAVVLLMSSGALLGVPWEAALG